MLILFRRWLLGQPALKNPRVFGSAFGERAVVRNAFQLRRMVLVLLTFCLLFQPKAAADVKEVKRVLVFYEMGLSSPAVTLIDHEMSQPWRIHGTRSSYIASTWRRLFSTIRRYRRRCASRIFASIKIAGQI